MTKTPSILLLVHVLTYQGQRLLHEKWASFVEALRKNLQQHGIERQNSGDELLLFQYNHPYPAYTSVVESLERAKKEVGWAGSTGRMPVQIVIHLEKEGDKPFPLKEPGAKLWDTLQQETPYVSRPLKMLWEQFMEGRKLPAHHFENDETGLFQIKFADAAQVRIEKLFAYRDRPLVGKFKECFYCGMTHHKPAKCPSKQLTAGLQGINAVGYLSFDEINAKYREIFSDSSAMGTMLASGIEPAMIRKDSALCVFLSYFDINLIYQPRFLWATAFAVLTTWDGTGRTDKIKIENRNLQMGLDCLRVGQYEDAYKLLTKENQALAGQQFFANVGLAFIALERERTRDMAHHFEIASGLAGSEREKIYISLLLSRFYDLDGHLWKAEQALENVQNLYVDCAEILYRRVQILVRNGEAEQALRLLRNLVEENRRIFITAMMDPMLLPIHGLVEDILNSRIQAVGQESFENLALARTDCEGLRAWFDSDDPDLAVHLKTIENIEKKYHRKNYFDLVDVAATAKALSRSCPKLREAKLDALNGRADEVFNSWQKYHQFWQAYSYKTFFARFDELLKSSKRKIVDARSLAGENLGKAKERLKAARGDLKLLIPIYARMTRLRIFLDAILVFLKKLLLTEVLLSGVVLVLFPAVTMLLMDSSSADFIALLKDPQIQKKGLVVVNMLIAPLAAFAQTVHSFSDK